MRRFILNVFEKVEQKERKRRKDDVAEEAGVGNGRRSNVLSQGGCVGIGFEGDGGFQKIGAFHGNECLPFAQTAFDGH